MTTPVLTDLFKTVSTLHDNGCPACREQAREAAIVARATGSAFGYSQTNSPTRKHWARVARRPKAAVMLRLWEQGRISAWQLYDAAVAVTSGTGADLLTYADRSRLLIPMDGPARVTDPKPAAEQGETK
jgi:hypothetical protein